jgi:hypothetical protein
LRVRPYPGASATSNGSDTPLKRIDADQPSQWRSCQSELVVLRDHSPKIGGAKYKIKSQQKSYETEQDDRVQIWVCNESRAFNIHFDIANPRLCHRLKRFNDGRQNHSRMGGRTILALLRLFRVMAVAPSACLVEVSGLLPNSPRRNDGSRRVNAVWALAPRAVASGASERRFRLKHNSGGHASSQCECDCDINQSLFHVPTPGLKAIVR